MGGRSRLGPGLGLNVYELRVNAFVTLIYESSYLS
jgi:hypothetical protein